MTVKLGPNGYWTGSMHRSMANNLPRFCSSSVFSPSLSTSLGSLSSTCPYVVYGFEFALWPIWMTSSRRWWRRRKGRRHHLKSTVGQIQNFLLRHAAIWGGIICDREMICTLRSLQIAPRFLLLLLLLLHFPSSAVKPPTERPTRGTQLQFVVLPAEWKSLSHHRVTRQITT